MSALTEDFIVTARGQPVNHRSMPSHFAGAGRTSSRCIYVGLAIVIAAFALLFVYSVAFVFRTGYVGAPS